MSENTWGDLPKSQIDNQLITEAIDLAIANHEADPTAHLGDGESLEQHKSNEVIDHPAQSIVPDKFSNDKVFLYIPVVPPDPGSVDNLTAYDSNPFLNLDYSSPRTGGGVYNITDFIPADLGYDSGDIIFDFIVNALGSSGTWQNTFWFSWGSIDLKAGYYRIGYYDSSWHYSSWIALDVTVPIRFRFLYDSANSMLYVFIRGTQVYSHSYTFGLDGGEFIVMAQLERGSSSTTNLYLASLNVWFEGI